MPTNSSPSTRKKPTAGAADVTPEREAEILHSLLSLAHRDTHRISRGHYQIALKELCRNDIGALRKKVAALREETEQVVVNHGDRIVFDYEMLLRWAKLGSFERLAVDLQGEYPGIQAKVLARCFERDVPKAERRGMDMGKGGKSTFARHVLFTSWHAEFPNQIWQVDTYHIDAWAKGDRQGSTPAEKKIQVVVIIDDFSRRLMIRGFEVVNADNVASVLVEAFLAWGVPGKVMIDNGKEYKNHTIDMLCAAAGTSLQAVARRRGDKKGKVERAIRTIARWTSWHYPSWTRGKASSLRYSIEGGSRMEAPTVSQILDDLAKVETRYNNRVHRAIKCTPLEMFLTHPGFTPVHPQLHKIIGYAPQHVFKNGVRVLGRAGVIVEGALYLNIDPESPGLKKGWSGKRSFEEKVEQDVIVRRVPGDPTRVGLHTRDNRDHKSRFICIATRVDTIDIDLIVENTTDNDLRLHRMDLLRKHRYHAIADAFEARCIADGLKHDPEHLAAIAETERNKTQRLRFATMLNVRPADLTIGAVDTGSGRVQTVEFRLKLVKHDVTEDDAIDVLVDWSNGCRGESFRLRTPAREVRYHPETRTATHTDLKTGQTNEAKIRLVVA